MRYVRRYPVELPELAELLPQITTPVMIINGRHDRVVDTEFEGGHFIWEEAPADYASIVIEAIQAEAGTPESEA